MSYFDDNFDRLVYGPRAASKALALAPAAAPPRPIASAVAAFVIPNGLQQLDLNSSSSQAKTYDKCARKWALQKVYGIREEEKRHFMIGHTFHSIAERYLSREAKAWEDLFPAGWDKNLDPTETAWMRFCAEEAVSLGIWKAKPGIVVEYPVCYLVGREFIDARGMPWLCKAETYLDAKGVRKIAKPTQLIDGSPLPLGWDRLPPFVGFIDHVDFTDPEVVDHKTAKSRKYALSPAKLALDIQVLNYAAVILAMRPEVTVVKLRHNVFLKGEGEKEPVYSTEATTDVATVAANWAKMIQMAEDMAVIRRMAPKVTIPGKPEHRADNFHMVRSAIDTMMTKDACEAYGGCPFRDACFGRATMAQVVTRLDTPSIASLVTAKPVEFKPLGLAAIPSIRPPKTGLIQTTSQEFSMFSNAKPVPKFNMYDLVYTRDPENAAVQYRAAVVNHGYPGANDPILMIFPDANVEPDLTTLPQQYTAAVPESALSSAPYPDAVLTGYAASMISHGIQPQPWKPAASPRYKLDGASPLVNTTSQPPGPGAALAAADAPVKRPERDDKFSSFGAGPSAPATAAGTIPPAAGVAQGVLAPGVGAALAGQMARVAADNAAAAPPPNTGYHPKVGDLVRVKVTDHSYWGKMVGQEGRVTDVGIGANNEPEITVQLAGTDYPPVAASRFELVEAKEVPAPPPLVFEEVLKLKGQIVSVILAGNPIPQNGALHDVYLANGVPAISMFDGKTCAFLKDVISIKLLQLGDVPGQKPPKVKLTPEQKAAAKEAEKAAKAAAKAAVKQAEKDAKAAEKAAAGTPPAPPAPAAAAVPPPPAAVQQTVPGTQGLNGGNPTPPLFTNAEIADRLLTLRGGAVVLAQNLNTLIQHVDHAISMLGKR